MIRSLVLPLAALAAILAARPCAAVPGFAQIGVGAGDLVFSCTAPHHYEAQSVVEGCTNVIKSTAYYGQAWPYSLRAIAYDKLGKLDLALADMDQAIILSPKGDALLPIFYHDRCDMRGEAGKLQDALTDCNASLELRPNNASTLDSRATVEYKIGDYTAAIADCTAALAVDPKMASSLYTRGLAKGKTGDAAGSSADIAAAKAIDPTVGGDQ